jgi:hypothetical protein
VKTNARSITFDVASKPREQIWKSTCDDPGDGKTTPSRVNISKKIIRLSVRIHRPGGPSVTCICSLTQGTLTGGEVNNIFPPATTTTIVAMSMVLAMSEAIGSTPMH